MRLPNAAVKLTLLLMLQLKAWAQNHTYRYEVPLLYPPQSPSRVQWIIGFGIPWQDLTYETMTSGIVVKTIYRLPATVTALRTHTTYPIHPTSREFRAMPQLERHWLVEAAGVAEEHADSSSKGSSSPTSFRWAVYKALEGLANRMGYPGGVCMLRSICEAAETPLSGENGLYGELLHILLTPSLSADTLSSPADNAYFHAESLGRSGARCDVVFRKCARSLIDQITDVHELSKYLSCMF